MDVEKMTDSEFEALCYEVAGERAPEEKSESVPESLRHYGETPSGGSYSVAYYYDKDGEPCERADAASVNIVEYNDKDERINETYSLIRK